MAQVQIPLAARRALNPVLGMAGVKGLTRYTVTFNSAGDNSVYATAPNGNYGGATSVAISTTKNGLFIFNYTTIPAGASIVSGNFKIALNVNAAASVTISLYRILVANSTWTEALSTWNYANTGTSTRWAGDVGSDGGGDAGCSQSGTDYSATLLGSFNVTSGDPAGTVYTADLTLSEFNLLLAANYGMVMKSNSATNTTFKMTGNSPVPQSVVVYDA